MDTSLHTLCALFAQLGLPDSPADIRAFIASHPLPADTAIEDAPFWNAAQAASSNKRWTTTPIGPSW